jgi:hypothetical protein
MMKIWNKLENEMQDWNKRTVLGLDQRQLGHQQQIRGEHEESGRVRKNQKQINVMIPKKKIKIQI